MTEQEFNDGHRRFNEYMSLKSRLNKIAALRFQVDASGISQVSIGNGYAKHDMNVFDDDLRNRFSDFVKGICSEQISRIEKQMEEL